MFGIDEDPFYGGEVIDQAKALQFTLVLTNICVFALYTRLDYQIGPDKNYCPFMYLMPIAYLSPFAYNTYELVFDKKKRAL